MLSCCCYLVIQTVSFFSLSGYARARMCVYARIRMCPFGFCVCARSRAACVNTPSFYSSCRCCLCRTSFSTAAVFKKHRFFLVCYVMLCCCRSDFSFFSLSGSRVCVCGCVYASVYKHAISYTYCVYVYVYVGACVYPASLQQPQMLSM